MATKHFTAGKKAWTQEHITKMTEYFRKERMEKKGDFTEFVVRMYYLIYQACSLSEDRSCPTSDVKAYRVKDKIYEGIDDDSTISHRSVIDDCVEHLRVMHYIRMHKSAEGTWRISLNRPLDFLLEGEHEAYLKKYNITKEIPIPVQK